MKLWSGFGLFPQCMVIQMTPPTQVVTTGHCGMNYDLASTDTESVTNRRKLLRLASILLHLMHS